jgi:predicted nuclease of predicted toxin-antitoxin system
MKFFLDENIPKSVSSIILKSGHEFIDIRGSKKEGLPDIEIFQLAQENKAIFITTDKDFFNTIPFHFESHFGIIIITLSQPDSKRILEIFKWVVNNIDIRTLENKIYLFKDETYLVKSS